jgi:uncharacterized protein YrrD
MLQNIKELYGNTLSAKDGEIGKVKDFYFDDQAWAVRYLVADTGTWLVDNLVLLSPHSFGTWDRDEKALQINLTREQIEKSPPITKHLPVSRHYEEDYYRYYGWSTYWQGDGMWGMSGYPMVSSVPLPVMMETSLPADLPEPHRAPKQKKDVHLRSTQEIGGYKIQATDGEIGSVSGFMIDDKSWAVGEIIVDAGHWYAGKEVFIKPDQIRRISYDDAAIFVTLTKADIQRTEEHGVAGA